MTECVKEEYRGNLGAAGKYLSCLRRFEYSGFTSQRLPFDSAQGRPDGWIERQVENISL
jgi:hypothetical protein